MKKDILIIGGTGTLGNAILPLLLGSPDVKRVRILSRGEHKQVEMADTYRYKPVDFFLGDVFDKERVVVSCRDVDEVYHLAAMKHIHKAQMDPHQAIKTNILGTMNVIHACIVNNVKKCMFTSTDKAVSPSSIYGLSKAVAEQLWISGNIGNHNSRFSAVRYGNVLSSQGSVIEKWKNQLKEGLPLTVTDPTMTRFFISVQGAARFVTDCMDEMTGGEVFIPKMKSTFIGKLVSLFHGIHDVVGRRPGEKGDELLISEDEAHLVHDLGDKFVRYPDVNLFPVTKRGESFHGTNYSSLSAPKFTKEELRIICQLPSLQI